MQLLIGLPHRYFIFLLCLTDTKFLIVLGDRSKMFRLKKSMTQRELAMLCGFEKASMSGIESGKTNITIITLRKISKTLSVEITEFFKEKIEGC